MISIIDSCIYITQTKLDYLIVYQRRFLLILFGPDQHGRFYPPTRLKIYFKCRRFHLRPAGLRIIFLASFVPRKLITYGNCLISRHERKGRGLVVHNGRHANNHFTRCIHDSFSHAHGARQIFMTNSLGTDRPILI